MTDPDLGPFGDHRDVVEEIETLLEGSRRSAFPAGEEVVRLERASDKAIRALPRYMLSKLGGSPSNWTHLHHEVFAQVAQMEHDRRLTERHIAALEKVERAANRLGWIGIAIAVFLGLAQVAAQVLRP